MEVIKKAFEESLREKKPMLQKGWWGCFVNDTYYIMRYGHCMVGFTKQQFKIFTCETKTDHKGLEVAVKLIQKWQKLKAKQ